MLRLQLRQMHFLQMIFHPQIKCSQTLMMVSDRMLPLLMFHNWQAQSQR